MPIGSCPGRCCVRMVPCPGRSCAIWCAAPCVRWRCSPNAGSREHTALVQDFVRRPLEAGTVHIFGRLEAYVASHADVLLLSARRRDEGALQAFVLGDYASLSTAFYMFAFRRQDAVPGCADALLDALVREAEMRGHSRFCLGLGIEPASAFSSANGMRIRRCPAWKPAGMWEVLAAMTGLPGCVICRAGGGKHEQS